MELNKIVKLTYELTDVYLCSMFHNIQAPKNSSRSNAGNRCKSVVLNSRQILSLPVMLFLFDDKQITFIMIHTQWCNAKIPQEKIEQGTQNYHTQKWTLLISQISHKFSKWNKNGFPISKSILPFLKDALILIYLNCQRPSFADVLLNRCY